MTNHYPEDNEELTDTTATIPVIKEDPSEADYGQIPKYTHQEAEQHKAEPQEYIPEPQVHTAQPQAYVSEPDRNSNYDEYIPQPREYGKGRRAALELRYIEPWSALKISSVISGALFVIWMIATGIIYLLLDIMGVWSKLSSSITNLDGTQSASGGGISIWLIFTLSFIGGIIMFITITASSVLGAIIYNLCSDIAGGVTFVLSDRPNKRTAR